MPKSYRAPALYPQSYGFDEGDSEAQQSLTSYHFQTNALDQFLTWLKQSPYVQNTIVVATGDRILKEFSRYPGPIKPTIATRCTVIFTYPNNTVS